MNPTSSRYHFLYSENEKMADNAKGTGDDGPNARKRKATATFQFVENQKENGSNGDYDINGMDSSDHLRYLHFNLYVFPCILVKTATGKIVSLRVKGSDTIGSVKLKIQAQEHIPFDHQELLFNEKVLENINTLANLHIINGSTLILPDKSVELMEIFVYTFTGKTISLSVKPTDTIYHVKSMVEQEEDIPCEEQALVFNNEVLGDNGTLFDFKIITKSILMLMQRSRGFMHIYIKTFTGDTITLKVKPLDNIGSIKAKIKNETGIPSDEQELVYNGMVLHNNDTLADFHINKESTLTLMHLSKGIMMIFIETQDGNTRDLVVKPSDTIHTMKIKIFNDVGIRPCEQRLLWKGIPLSETATLADWHVPNESTLHLHLVQRGC
ncbi:hypothetical protein E3N88_14587 [Mikania micrantha]|uniref:Ubiquitin-like domain-containing protein n=1 Tax=Mikania micrantha TaxID=192012 RepID=A0A5N6P365_9ASTR|nr:hypothetical protein E3N88_14587 [Mikania micrantha]